MKRLIRFFRTSGFFKTRFDELDQYRLKTLPKEGVKFITLFPVTKDDKESRVMQIRLIGFWRAISHNYLQEQKIGIGLKMLRDITTYINLFTITLIIPAWLWFFRMPFLHGFLSGLGHFALMPLTIVLFNILQMPIIKLSEKIFKRKNIIILPFVLLNFAYLYIWKYFGADAHSLWQQLISGGLFGSVLINVWALLFSLAGSAYTFRYCRKQKEKQASVRIMSAAWDAFRPYPVKRWRIQSQQTAKALNDLEKLARSFEKYYPEQLFTRDLKTQIWLKQSCMEMANAVRNLKKEVCLPGPGTNEKVKAHLHLIIQSIATNDWQAIPRVPMDAAFSPISKFRKVLIWIITSLLPLAIAIAAALIWPHFEFKNAAIVLTSVWTVVSIFNLIDPDFQQKIQNTQSLMSLNPLKRKKD